MNDFTRLLYPNSTVSVISARSLHKGVRMSESGASDEASSSRASVMQDIAACISDCHRILRPGGRFEFAFFESALSNCSPLTAKLEDFLYDHWCPKRHVGPPSSCLDSKGGESGDAESNKGSGCSHEHSGSFTCTASYSETRVTVQELNSLLKQVGFEDGRQTLATFHLLTLGQIFDYAGEPQHVAPGKVTDEESHELSDQACD